MCRSRTIPRGEFLWQGSCPDRDVVMVPVSAFHADPVYGIAHPVDMEGKYPGQEVERDFSLGYGFTLRHLCACLSLTGRYTILKIAITIPAGSLRVFFGRGAGHRFPVSPSYGVRSGPGKQSFFFANLDGILPGTVNAILSDVRGSYAITSFIVGPGSRKISKHKCK